MSCYLWCDKYERGETKRVKIKEGRSPNEVKSEEGVKERWSGEQQETAEW